MQGSLFSRFLQGLFYLAFLAAFVAGGLFIAPKFAQRSDLGAQHAALLHQIEERQHEIAEVKERQRRFNTDREFVEMLARRNHRLFPGEVVFVFEK